MAAMVTKLIVEVIEARDLLPKDGTGTSSPYVVADFGGQRRRTQTVCHNLNPTWNEVLEFNVSSSTGIDGELLEVEVQHDRRIGPCRRNNFLGRIRLDSRQFVRKGEEALIHYPLEKKSFFSWVRGVIGLRIYYDDVPVELVAPTLPPKIEENETNKGEVPQPDAAAVDENVLSAEQTPVNAKNQDKEIPPEPPKTNDENPPEQGTATLPEPLFVRVVRARSLPHDSKPHVRVAAYGRRAATRTARRSAFFEWDETFAFARDTTAGDSSMLEISVWDLPPDTAGDEDRHFLGGVCFDVSEVLVQDPPDRSLAPQWYRLEGGGSAGGDLMIATWDGTQADESFADAWKANSSPASRSKIYLSPKLWYLRATVIEAEETPTPTREFSIAVRATLGFQVLKTHAAIHRNGSPSWNEDLLFVASEPFGEEERLNLWLESRQGKDIVILGSAAVSLSSVERRVDDRKVASRWIDLLPAAASGGVQRRCGGRLHVRVLLDGGYHVQDEPQHAASDYRPAARQLWQPPVGTVELGIIGCHGLLPMKAVNGKGTTDAFAVAKYGPKWARTRTITDSFEPTWNEQFTWPVYEISTVLTLAFFDDASGGGSSVGFKDSSACRPIGRIRIRISTLEARRAYRSSYPLLLLLPNGLKRMGEVEIAVRFMRTVSQLDLLHLYSQPILPAMHHIRPIGSPQRESLRVAAARITAVHLARTEPPLRREIVMWILETSAPPFSMRRVRANWCRIAAATGWIFDGVLWLTEIREWRNPTASVMTHGVVLLLVWFPDLIVPAVAVHLGVVGLWRYPRRPMAAVAGAAARESGVEGAEREELDEEFDAVPSSRGEETVRSRYERVRAVGARLQGMLGDVAAQAERVQAVVSWRDPRATGLFVAACFVLAMVIYVVPARIMVTVAAFYYLRHPVFRRPLPPPVINFFRRLPSLADRII